MPQKFNSADEQSTGEYLPSALATEVCLDLTAVSPDTAEIYRYIGYPRDAVPMPSITQRIEQILPEARLSLRFRGTYTLYAVTGQNEGSLQIGGVTIFGNIGEFLAEVNRIAVFVVTAGEEISRLSEDAAQKGDVFAAWVMDALGSWAAEAAADALMERIQKHLHNEEALTLRYSPGYCGMDIAQQRILFKLARADSVGVELIPSLLMHPLKSVSGIVGLGPKEVVSRYHSPCAYCTQVGCHMRR